MDNEGNNITDRKLLAIMNSGGVLLRDIDPEGLLAMGFVSAFTLNTESMTWGFTVKFANGDRVNIGGGIKDGKPSVFSVRMPLPENKWETFNIKPSKNLLSALSPLSGVPLRLKRCLAPMTKKTGETEKFGRFLKLTSELIMDALLWDVEGGEKKEYTDKFKTWNIRFYENDYGQTGSASFISMIRNPDSRISISAEADIYGLGAKRVELEKNLGMNKTALIDCKSKKDGKTVPSLKVAFDLDRLIPVCYTKERRKKESIGKPKAKAKD